MSDLILVTVPLQRPSPKSRSSQLSQFIGISWCTCFLFRWKTFDKTVSDLTDCRNLNDGKRRNTIYIQAIKTGTNKQYNKSALVLIKKIILEAQQSFLEGHFGVKIDLNVAPTPRLTSPARRAQRRFRRRSFRRTDRSNCCTYPQVDFTGKAGTEAFPAEVDAVQFQTHTRHREFRYWVAHAGRAVHWNYEIRTMVHRLI